MRRSVKTWVRAAGLLLGVPVLLLAAILVGANTERGRDFIEHLVLVLSGGDVTLQGLSGRFPDHLRAARIEVRDTHGAYLVIEQLALDWEPLHLLLGEALIDRLAAERIELVRLPVESSTTWSFSLPIAVALRSLAVARLDLSSTVAGSDVAFSITGSGDFASLERGELRLDVEGFNGAGSYRIEADFDPATVAGRLTAEEPAKGLVANLAGMKDLGAITVDATVNGPRSALATELSLKAGPLTARVQGKLDLIDRAADLTLQASAAAMRPRPDLSWQSLSLAATVSGRFTQPTITGTVNIAELIAGGVEIGTVAAGLQGHAGQLRLHASLDGLHIPGPRPDLLAAAPLLIQAEAQLDAPERPVTFTLRHPLIDAEGTVRTAGALAAAAALQLPDLGPLGAIAGIDVGGHSQIEITASKQGDATAVEAKGTVAVTGGATPLPGLLGKAARIDVSASLQGEEVTGARLQIAGKTLKISAQGSITSKVVDLDWKAALSDLAILTPVVSGSLKAQGHVGGREDNLAVTADVTGEVAAEAMPRAPITAHLKVKGLPAAPSGEINAQGTLAGSVLQLAAVARQSGDGVTQIDIQRADWKSAHVQGRFALAPKAAFPVGTLDLRMTRLQDLEPLTGQPLTGTLTASVKTRARHGRPQARLAIDVRNAGLAGTGSVDHLNLMATVFNPASKPVVDANLVAEGIAVDGVTGSATLAAKGTKEALTLQLAADAKDSTGTPLRLTGSAVFDAMRERLTVSALRARWKGEALRLLAPAQLAFADGLSVDHLRLGIQDGVLAVAGRITPTLSLTADVENLPVALATVFVPGLKPGGTIGASARFAGTLARPTGTIKVTASGLRLLAGPARSLPAGGFTASAVLLGETARIDSRLTLGPATNLSVTGQVPIDSTQPMDLRLDGPVDLALANPILTAAGRRLRGHLQLHADISGALADPVLNGSIELSGGEFQDYRQGIYIKAIDALLQLKGNDIRIARLTGRVGPGTLSASGTVGILTPGLPINLTVTAHDARPLASDLLTVNLNADLTITGELLRQLLLSGTIDINQAEIRIPETLPASVATLDVHRAGPKPPRPEPVIDLDLTIEAQRRIFVRGRGLDAELGGSVRVRGTADNPQPIGAFNMVRGRVDLTGQTLIFTKGKVSFNGGSLTNPSLDFAAGTTNGTITARLNIGGTISVPKITLSSTPELPQDEIVAQLLFGRSASSLSPFELAQIAAALAELTGVTAWDADILGGIRKGLGLDRLSLGSGSSGKPTLEAGRYVAPDVYVGVEQGVMAAGTKAKVQIDLTKHLKLEGRVSTDSGSATGSASNPSGGGGSSIGATYQFEY